MLKKENRLTKRKEFGYIYKHGKKLSSSKLSMVTIPTKLSHPRFGFVITKKVGKAHTRNLIKRQMSEIIRLNLKNFDTKHNYIFIAKFEVVGSNYYEIEKHIFYLLKKANLYQEVGE